MVWIEDYHAQRQGMTLGQCKLWIVDHERERDPTSIPRSRILGSSFVFTAKPELSLLDLELTPSPLF